MGGRSEQMLLAYTVEPGSRSAEALAFLANWSAAEQPVREVPGLALPTEPM
ncbi:hypothetical protein [Streptomyces sp. NPDC057877]|uniref:hypothetical protein n=1 Tax=Streptomyces sp. NPDC057877 TaxID=3346269 RepID=UPI0036780AD7